MNTIFENNIPVATVLAMDGESEMWPAEKTECFYIISNQEHAAQKKYIYGGLVHRNELAAKLDALNKGRTEDLFSYAKVVDCWDYKEFAARLRAVLEGSAAKGDPKRICVSFEHLCDILDAMAHNETRDVDQMKEIALEIVDAAFAHTSSNLGHRSP